MSPAFIALAVTVAIAPTAGDERRVAHAPLPSDERAALFQGPAPAPPGRIARRPERYGDVTIGHAKHLAVRAPCTECHDVFPVGPIAFTPQTAHRACIGCHK